MSAQRFTVASSSLELVQGDVTQQDTDAIGNAANAMLIGGGGVDGAIHDAAGPDLGLALRALKKKLPGGVLPTGGAILTPGFSLKAKHVVHCVGPIYSRDRERAPELLASCYREALRLVREKSLASIAFPSISTGVYGYPVHDAARVAVETVATDLRESKGPSLVRFVLFDSTTLQAYVDAATGLL
jgi:O-acetyl-ADP-ribose deacetylase (regulator of RNase III)